ncbi:hypothetical protein E4U43_008188 [Claviceps pusilla]|uniref:Nitroreductase domain-containing protein n=1 Tax=Claviceps pusilla TaxID=123648 RepID=A0A9P7NBS0_9HYPO|nr:hypothetical protein E4U43_008188 [Claviceps pusilla]
MATTNDTLVTSDQWLAAAKHRRTVYGLKGTSQVSDQKVQSIIEQVLSFSPSAYNSQTTRVTLVTGEKHKQFWDVVISTSEPFLKAVGEEVWNVVNGHFQAFKAAYGSARPITKPPDDHLRWLFLLHFPRNSPRQFGSPPIVFWESGNAIKQAAEKHKSVAHMFGEFSEHANGMNQILVWSALELEGVGANLQHFNAIPGVEDAVKKFCQVPDDYKLRAHLNYRRKECGRTFLITPVSCLVLSCCRGGECNCASFQEKKGAGNRHVRTVRRVTPLDICAELKQEIVRPLVILTKRDVLQSTTMVS